MAWETMKDGSIRHRNETILEEVDVDADGMTVRLEAGTGHMRIDLDTHIPMAELVGLLERAGFEVTPCMSATETDTKGAAK